MTAIAIDGPASAGKSTVSRILSEKLGFLYLDTGALYRAVAFYFVSNNLDYNNSSILEKGLKNIELKIEFKDKCQRIILCSQDITDSIRTDKISSLASDISSIDSVRKFLLDFQRDFAKKNNIIMDGRDIGTIVLPTADIKIFLTASLEARAKRRHLEYQSKGYKSSYEEILESIKQRDYNDSHRQIAPLVPAKDAAIVDTTEYTLDEVVRIIFNIIKKSAQT
ncbi:MAG: (d)CMP kinase [Oscillospiraceae bacterium]|jgi:cytidylate kinase|nr:(d)CMP kinase [Oscillospiraceae bacterium]